MNRTFPVFRVGTHTDSAGVERTFTAEDLRAIADKFNPEVGQAPIVKGHPADDDPAFGWIDRFLFEETSGVLYAVPREVEPGFAAEVKAGRFRRVSMALYSPNSKSNPVPGVYYPRHVGFLGAAAPAVSGLKAVNFNDAKEDYLMFEGNDEKTMHKFGETIANAFATALTKMGFKPAADPAPADPPAPSVKDSPEYQAAEAAREAAEAEAKRLRDESKAAADKAARQGCAAFTEGLVKDGKLTPAEAPGVTEVLFALDDENELEFTAGEGDDEKTVKAAPRKILSDMLKGLPKRIDYTEHAGRGENDLAAIGFNAPAGSTVDPARLEQHQRIAAYAAEKGISYEQAIPFIERGV